MTDHIVNYEMAYKGAVVLMDAADERIAQLQYEAGMYQSLYENARAQVESARGYVDRAIASYSGDPADNQFQKGFLAALEVVRDEAFPPVASTDRTPGGAT